MSIDLRLGELERQVRWLASRSERALEAVFVNTASSPSSSLRVTVPGYDDREHTFGPVVWSPLGGALPAAGDRALVAESDDGSWWVLAWWSSAQTVPSGPAAGAELAHVQATALVNITATTEATANTLVSAGAVTFDGSPVEVEFFAPYLRIPLAGGTFVDVYLYDGASSIGRLAHFEASAGFYTPMKVARRFSPSAGAHTYSIRMSVNAGTGQMGAGAGGLGADVPAFIRITKA